MAKFIVSYDVVFLREVEAESAEDAISKVDVQDDSGWDQTGTSCLEAEEVP